MKFLVWWLGLVVMVATLVAAIAIGSWSRYLAWVNLAAWILYGFGMLLSRLVQLVKGAAQRVALDKTKGAHAHDE